MLIFADCGGAGAILTGLGLFFIVEFLVVLALVLDGDFALASNSDIAFCIACSSCGFSFRLLLEIYEKEFLIVFSPLGIVDYQFNTCSKVEKINTNYGAKNICSKIFN